MSRSSHLLMLESLSSIKSGFSKSSLNFSVKKHLQKPKPVARLNHQSEKIIAAYEKEEQKLKNRQDKWKSKQALQSVSSVTTDTENIITGQLFQNFLYSLHNARLNACKYHPLNPNLLSNHFHYCDRCKFHPPPRSIAVEEDNAAGEVSGKKNVQTEQLHYPE